MGKALTTFKIMGLIGVLGASSVIGYHDYQDERGGCESSTEPQFYRIRKQNIDQVFRDHNGYRLYWHDKDGLVKEEKFDAHDNFKVAVPLIPEINQFKSTQSKEHFVIFKDIPNNEQPYAQILIYQLPKCTRNTFYVDVHLPANQSLAPGIDSYISGKAIIDEPMHEIK
ncbi:MAG: hypothetical protein AABY26_05565 [Nanoarchaeota archaeon]